MIACHRDACQRSIDCVCVCERESGWTRGEGVNAHAHPSSLMSKEMEDLSTTKSLTPLV
jgi:hypothetical protein